MGKGKKYEIFVWRVPSLIRQARGFFSNLSYGKLGMQLFLQLGFYYRFILATELVMMKVGEIAEVKTSEGNRTDWWEHLAVSRHAPYSYHRCDEHHQPTQYARNMFVYTYLGYGVEGVG